MILIKRETEGLITLFEKNRNAGNYATIERKDGRFDLVMPRRIEEKSSVSFRIVLSEIEGRLSDEQLSEMLINIENGTKTFVFATDYLKVVTHCSYEDGKLLFSVKRVIEPYEISNGKIIRLA